MYGKSKYLNPPVGCENWAKNRPKRLKFDTLQGVVKVNYTSAMDPIASYTKIEDWFICSLSATFQWCHEMALQKVGQNIDPSIIWPTCWSLSEKYAGTHTRTLLMLCHEHVLPFLCDSMFMSHKRTHTHTHTHEHTQLQNFSKLKPLYQVALGVFFRSTTLSFRATQTKTSSDHLNKTCGLLRLMEEIRLTSC